MTDHRVDWTHVCDLIRGRITCTADPERGALCRFTCPEAGCEEGWVGPAEKDGDGWFHDYVDPYAVDIKATGHQLRLETWCNITEWIDNSSGVEESYAGPNGEVRSGPIDVRWNGDDYEWQYAGEQP